MGDAAMNETFDKHVGAAVAGGWRAAVIGALVYLLAWAFYLVIIHARPAWLLELWGGSLEWSTVQTVSIYFFGALKALWFVFLFGLLFLALWRRQLRRLS
jgi:hypothetical protein